jgi:hypothetical protein
MAKCCFLAVSRLDFVGAVAACALPWPNAVIKRIQQHTNRN